MQPFIARTAQTPTASTVHHPFGRPGGPGLWHTGKQIPAYIQNVAHAFRRHGLGESEAIERAVGVVRDWAEGRTPNGKGRVHPDVQAAAAKAIAEWEKLRAEAHSSSAKRFNHNHAAAGSANGGQFTSGSGGKGASKSGGRKTATSHGPKPKLPSPHPARAHTGGHGAERRKLEAQVHGIRMRIRRLETELHALEQQHHAAAAAAAKTANAAKTAAKAGHAPVAKHHTATHRKHSTHAHSLAQRITSLRNQIGSLRHEAAQLEARARAL